ncbi:MAG: ComEC/Rec2 family competence protein, partial [Bacillota bacterium]
MRISSIGLAGWGLAGGITAAAVREWTPEGPTRVVWLSLAMVAAWRMGRAAARAIASAAGAGTARAVLGPPAWPPPSRPPPGSLLFPTGSRRRARLRRMAVILALTGLTGSWVGAYRIARQAAALREFEGGRVAWVGGFVAAPPQRTPFTVRVILHPAGLSNTPGRLPQGPWTTLPGAVQVEVPPQSATNVVPGAWVAVRGLVKLPEKAPYPGAFSPRRYLNARGVVLAVKARSAERVIPGTPPAPPPVVTKIRAAVLRAGIGVADRIRQRVGPVGSRWLLAVGLGERDALTPSQQEALQAAGLGHLLSVSGVHVGLVAGPFVALARRMARSRPGVRPASAGAAVAAGWLYAAMTGLSAPAVRASMVQTVALAVWAAGRRAGLVDALGVAGAVQLLSGNPHLGSDPGFQMSYVATLGIGLFLLACDGRMQGRPLSHGLWLFRVVQVIDRQALVALGISAFAWACVSPLVMAYFGRASVVGALMSVPA